MEVAIETENEKLFVNSLLMYLPIEVLAIIVDFVLQELFVVEFCSVEFVDDVMDFVYRFKHCRHQYFFFNTKMIVHLDHYFYTMSGMQLNRLSHASIPKNIYKLEIEEKHSPVDHWSTCKQFY